MAASIETFMAKLQSEGVQAGKDAAEIISEEARQQALVIVQNARAEADNIIASARSEAESIHTRNSSELTLAARDTVHQLHNTLTQLLRNILTGPVAEDLGNTDFLSLLLHDIIMQYARADSEHKLKIDINVSPDMAKQLAQWAINELRQATIDNSININLQGTLQEEGFEYKYDGTTIDVTVESVIEILAELIGPHFRQLYESSNV